MSYLEHSGKQFHFYLKILIKSFQKNNRSVYIITLKMVPDIISKKIQLLHSVIVWMKLKKIENSGELIWSTEMLRIVQSFCFKSTKNSFLFNSFSWLFDLIQLINQILEYITYTSINGSIHFSCSSIWGIMTTLQNFCKSKISSLWMLWLLFFFSENNLVYFFCVF